MLSGWAHSDVGIEWQLTSGWRAVVGVTDRLQTIGSIVIDDSVIDAICDLIESISQTEAVNELGPAGVAAPPTQEETNAVEAIGPRVP